MRPNSLSFRLSASSALVSLVLLALAGFLLDRLNSAIVDRLQDNQLEAVLNSVLNSVELDENNRPIVGHIGDARYTSPLSGWYWQITPLGGPKDRGIASGSLLEHRLRPDNLANIQRNKDGVAYFYITDTNNQRLRAMQKSFTLFGYKHQFSFIVTSNTSVFADEVAAFRNALILVLVFLGLGLIAAVFLQVRFGLRPLNRLRKEVSGIREGISNRLTGQYPSEIEPVSRELNLLIDSNEQVIERARTQVGNLAHALKTPLSVLTNEANLTGGKGKLASKVLEQAGIMRDQVSMYLDRARRAARAKSLGSVTDVREVVDALLRTLLRIHSEAGFETDVICDTKRKFRGERQDLEEMIGNLLDNAFKWANRRVDVRISDSAAAGEDGREWLEIVIMDDGPGLPDDEACERVTKRGLKLDEKKPGSGLGLSIVSETAAMYEGRFRLQRRPDSGLAAHLVLPAV